MLLHFSVRSFEQNLFSRSRSYKDDIERHELLWSEYLELRFLKLACTKHIRFTDPSRVESSSVKVGQKRVISEPINDIHRGVFTLWFHI